MTAVQMSGQVSRKAEGDMSSHPASGKQTRRECGWTASGKRFVGWKTGDQWAMGREWGWKDCAKTRPREKFEGEKSDSTSATVSQSLVRLQLIRRRRSFKTTSQALLTFRASVRVFSCIHVPVAAETRVHQCLTTSSPC